MTIVATPDTKPMRKGTRSCRECRRRKVKCNWPHPTAQICSECLNNARQCLRQADLIGRPRVSKSNSVLKLNVSPITPVIERMALLQHVPISTENSSKQSRLRQLEDQLLDLDHLDDASRKTSPLFGLFDNKLFSQIDTSTTTSPCTASIISFGKQPLSDLEKLHTVIAQEPHVMDILDTDPGWFVSWRDYAWVPRDQDLRRSLRTFVEGRLAQDDPVVYASGLLCLALALQQAQMSCNSQNLILCTSPAEFIERITTAVDQVVLSKDLHDENTILLYLQRAKLHAEGNQLRKSWLRIRQALTVLRQAELANNNSDVNEEATINRHRMAGSMYEIDRFMSMILGFPHSENENFTDLRAKTILHSVETDLDLRMRAIRRVVAVAAGSINDRNAQGNDGNNQSSIAATQSIHATLEDAASCMPCDWWDITNHIQNVQTSAGFEHLMTQLWFWQIQSFLHLPQMLADNGRGVLNSSRSICLHAARRMLEVFCALRGTPALSVYLCACDDFQGVLTACILSIGNLIPMSLGTYPSLESDSNGQLEDDLGLLQDVKEIFRYRAHERGNSISMQGLKAVETLESFLVVSDGQASNAGRQASIILPYFGLVIIEYKAKSPIPTTGRLGDQATTAETSPHAAVRPTNSQEESPITTEDGRRTPQLLPDEVHEQLDLKAQSMTESGDVDWDAFLHGYELGQDWNSIFGQT